MICLNVRVVVRITRRKSPFPDASARPSEYLRVYHVSTVRPVESEPMKRVRRRPS